MGWGMGHGWVAIVIKVELDDGFMWMITAGLVIAGTKQQDHVQQEPVL